MAKRTRITSPTPERRGRPGIVPPLGVDFETALGALLKTPPPPKGEVADKPKLKKGRKRKGR
jgi:hypothetical protein